MEAVMERQMQVEQMMGEQQDCRLGPGDDLPRAKRREEEE